MNHYLYKLIPPRPTFPADMSQREGEIMEAHFGYWARLIDERRAVTYGPVLDPTGTYGIAVLEVDDEPAAQGLASEDPAVRAGAGFGFELLPMMDVMVRWSARLDPAARAEPAGGGLSGASVTRSTKAVTSHPGPDRDNDWIPKMVSVGRRAHDGGRGCRDRR